MKHLLLKIVAFALLVVFCAFLMSQAKVKSETIYPENFYGKYALQSTGNLNQPLDGEIYFETAIATNRNSHKASILKLRLGSKDKNFTHSIEFIISKAKMNQIASGSYEVSQKSRGFLKNFDGVFGFANISSLGELPFFTKSGEVRIDFVDADIVKGALNVSLQNANGKSINLEGDFVALK